MRRSELARAAESATAKIAKILPELKPSHREALLPGLSLLASLGETKLTGEPLPRSRLQLFADLHRQLSFMEAGERLAAICERLVISKATYYRRIDAALAAGLVSNQSHESLKIGVSGETGGQYSADHVGGK